jgi:dienelactone hydrolase
MSPGMAFVFVLAQFVAIALSGPSAAADGIGIVLLHGKQGMPSSPNLSSLTESLTKAGLLLERPEMCWSRRRIYDRSYPTCLEDIDAAVERLKSRGASVIIIAGQSLGANAAIAYGTGAPARPVVVDRRQGRFHPEQFAPDFCHRPKSEKPVSDRGHGPFAHA